MCTFEAVLTWEQWFQEQVNLTKLSALENFVARKIGEKLELKQGIVKHPVTRKTDFANDVMWPAKGRERVKLIYLRPIYQYNRGQRQRQENDSIDQEHEPGNPIVQREKRTALFGKPLA